MSERRGGRTCPDARDEQRVLRLLAEIAHAAPKDEALSRLLAVSKRTRKPPCARRPSAPLLRDEKRAAQEDETPCRDAPLLPPAALHGGAADDGRADWHGFPPHDAHARLRRAAGRPITLEARNQARQRERLRGGRHRQRKRSWPPFQPDHARAAVCLAAGRAVCSRAKKLHREWAFTYRRETESGRAALAGRDRLLLQRAAARGCCWITRPIPRRTPPGRSSATGRSWSCTRRRLPASQAFPSASGRSIWCAREGRIRCKTRRRTPVQTNCIKSFLQSPQIRFFALTTGKNRGIVSMAQKGCGNANHRIDSIQHTIRR